MAEKPKKAPPKTPEKKLTPIEQAQKDLKEVTKAFGEAQDMVKSIVDRYGEKPNKRDPKRLLEQARALEKSIAGQMMKTMKRLNELRAKASKKKKTKEVKKA